MDRLARHLKTMAIEAQIQGEVKQEEDEEDEDKPDEETAESWLRRHLLESVSCDQQAVDTLLADAAPLIHLITSNEECRALFVIVKKNKIYNKEGLFGEKLPTVHFDVENTEKNGENKIEKPRRPTQKKKKTVTEKKIPVKGRQTISRSRSRSKSKSPGKKNKKTTEESKPKQKVKKIDEQQMERDRVLAAQIAQAQLERETMLAIPMIAEMVFDWHVDRSIPRSDQFLFIVNKTTVHDYDTHLDELFYIGYLNNNRFFKTALETAKSILDKRLTFEMSLDILLCFYGVEERKSPRGLMLENFVIDCIIRHFCVESRIRSDNAENRSVQSLLEPVVAKYCSDPEAYDRNCLLIQLSSFDIDLLNENTDLEQCAFRLSTALGSLRILNFLYSETLLDWCRKLFILVTDVYCTLLAKHVTRKCQILLDFNKDKIRPVCSTFSETVHSIKTLSKILFDSSDDQAPIEKLVTAFNVVVVLEDDIDEILQKVADLHCEKRDKAIERTGIREAHSILRQLNEYLEENCMESAIESSNLESLRQLATNMSLFEKKLDGVMAALPE